MCEQFNQCSIKNTVVKFYVKPETLDNVCLFYMQKFLASISAF